MYAMLLVDVLIAFSGGSQTVPSIGNEKDLRFFKRDVPRLKVWRYHLSTLPPSRSQTGSGASSVSVPGLYHPSNFQLPTSNFQHSRAKKYGKYGQFQAVYAKNASAWPVS